MSDITNRANPNTADAPRPLAAILLTCALLALSLPAAGESVRVAFLAPNPPENPFWGTMYKIMRATAQNLDIDLQLHFSRGNTYSYKKDGEAILAQTPAPDYFITGYWNGVTADHLKQAEARRIKTFIINTEISNEQLRLTGRPRGRFTHWIGHMRPDDHQGGYDLATTLIRAARSGGSGPVNMEIIGGSSDSDVSTQRVRGAENAVRAARDAVGATDKVYGMWLTDVTVKAMEKVLTAEKAPAVVWAASDTMALGAIEVLKKHGHSPGDDVFVGGVDWTWKGLEAVENGDLAVSYGGHFMEGAWALILIYDYHHGNDFADELGVSIHSALYAATRENAAAYRLALKQQAWNDVDFSRLSKTLNPGLNRYNFDPAILLNPR